MNTPVPAGAAANDDARTHHPADRTPLAPVTDISEALPGHDEVVTLSLREALALLDDRITGRVVIPGDPGWDEARAAWNLAVDQRPVAVVVAGSTNDIVQTVRAAKGLGLSVAPQATGHNAGPLAAANGLADALLLRTSELRDVQVDPDLRVARVEAGALWGDVVAAVAPHGLAALAGSSHDVGVVGYTLGGGISWLGRSHGLAANSVLAVELVTADGVRRRVDADHDPELFWAVRGGGGDFGVVTALEFRLHPVAEIVAGTLFFPLERAEEVLQAWAAWTADVPDTVMSVGRVLRFPPMPELPPFLSGQSFVVVEAAIQESPERADELLAPLRALAPAMDSVHPQPIAELLQLHMDPPGADARQRRRHAARRAAARSGARVRRRGRPRLRERAALRRDPPPRRRARTRTSRVRRPPSVARPHRVPSRASTRNTWCSAWASRCRAPARRWRHPSAGCSRGSSRGGPRSTTSTSPSTSGPPSASSATACTASAR